MNFSNLDLTLFALYCLTIICMGLYVSRRKKGHQTDSSDYFLAGKNLTWWAIGSALIAANISAEQFIGMSGSGRSEERRVGQGCVSTCRSRSSPYHYKYNKYKCKHTTTL